MRFVTALRVVLLSSIAIFNSSAHADDMLTTALKRVSELEAKNINLELNHRRLEEDYKALEERNRQLEKTNKAKETEVKKQEKKLIDRVVPRVSKPTIQPDLASAPAPIQAATRLDELSKIAFEGAYFGVNGGYGGGDIDTVVDRYFWTNSSNIRFSGPEVGRDINSIRAGGALAGGQFGYNYIFKNNFVAGAEFDFDWTDFGSQGSNSQTGFLSPKGAFINSASRNGLHWLSTERIKFGYLAGSFMPYITGGLAIAKSSYSENGYSLTSDTSVYASATQGGTSKVGVGWSAGAGIEYSLLKNLSLKTEYLYTQTPGTVIHNSSEPLAKLLRF